MFLKSNTKKIQDTQKSLDLEHLPKSILRDRSLPEAVAENHTEETNHRRLESEDDKKIVRFNLETKNIDIVFSDSEQKSISDEEIEVFMERNKSETVVKSRFTVSPVFDDNYKNIFATKKESLFEKIDNADKFEEKANRNMNLKLIKPNPTDFITPKLIAKPIDVVKPILMTSDSEEESVSKYKAKYPKVENIIIEKSNIADVIVEEDKSIDVSEKKELIDTATSPINENISMKEQIEKELEHKFEDYKSELKMANERKLKKYEITLLENTDQEIEKQREEILQRQELEFEELKAKQKQKQEEQLLEDINKLQEEMKKKYEKALAEEESKIQEKLELHRNDIERKFEDNIEKIESNFKEKEKEIESNFQMSLKQTEKEFLLKLEERIKEISIAHKAVIDRMKDDHSITLEELVRDFKSEVSK